MASNNSSLSNGLYYWQLPSQFRSSLMTIAFLEGNEEEFFLRSHFLKLWRLGALFIEQCSLSLQHLQLLFFKIANVFAQDFSPRSRKIIRNHLKFGPRLIRLFLKQGRISCKMIRSGSKNSKLLNGNQWILSTWRGEIKQNVQKRNSTGELLKYVAELQ